eukprot:CAMPEP_0116847554 /NCGR_PEP_ID=MMETSP0418-20121206/14500_1 /TAXON_ID=1158023 /ORGANISM="Astrosyne radiata, Strain 13vi08-1A" /LENGTH=422 /DNA_ID=CAMNT_0004479015 /DNA_START=9 /DNA_END=1277 /DNA_ORIENTATION=-
MAEQQKAAEESKTKELARQIQQEREQEELDRIAGRKSNRLDRGIDWMYQGATGGELAKEDAEKKAEEFLLGKAYVPEGEHTGDFAVPRSDALDAVVSSAAAVASGEVLHQDQPSQEPEGSQPTRGVLGAEPSVAERNEAFRLKHEDPMFLVSQRKREQEEKDEKKRSLYERVIGPDESKHADAGGKDWKRDRSRRCRGDRKKDRKRDRSRRGDHDEGDRKRRCRSRSRSNDHSSRKDEARSRKRSRHAYHSPSPSPERRTRRNDTRYRHRRDDHYESRRHRESDRPRNRGHVGYQEPLKANVSSYEREPRSSKYGLQGAVAPAKTGDLGPDRELLDRKRHARTEESKRLREMGGSRRHLTKEERENALREMQQNASERDAFRFAPRPSEEDTSTSSRGTARFLTDLAQETHGIHGGRGRRSG